MELKWVTSESLVRPKRVDEKISESGVYLRRNIQEVETDDGVKYTYLEAYLTKEEYKNYQLYKILLNEDDSEAYENYKLKLDTPVEYEENGHLYKPKWAQEIYAGLIEKGRLFPSLFPIKIWDATGLEENAEMMSLENLIALTLFLGTIQEQYFNEYKQEKM